jgi:hypothetical protein
MAALLVFLALIVLLFGVETSQRSLEDLSSTVGETGTEPEGSLRPAVENP